MSNSLPNSIRANTLAWHWLNPSNLWHVCQTNDNSYFKMCKFHKISINYNIIDIIFASRLDTGLLSSSCVQGSPWLDEGPRGISLGHCIMSWMRAQVVRSIGAWLACDTIAWHAVICVCHHLWLALASALPSLGIATTFEWSPRNLCSCSWKVHTVALITNSFVKRTPSLDASAREAAVKGAGGGATCKCKLHIADVSVAMGGLGAPVAEEVGLVGRLIELDDKDLNPLVDLHDGVLLYD